MSNLTDASNNVINLPRYAKKTIAIIIDLGSICIYTHKNISKLSEGFHIYINNILMKYPFLEYFS